MGTFTTDAFDNCFRITRLLGMNRPRGYAKLAIGGFGLEWILFENNKRVKIVKFKRGIKSDHMKRLRKIGYTIKSGYTDLHSKKLRQSLELIEL